MAAIAWGMIAAWLHLFRRYMNRPSGFWTWLNRRSCAVYIIHPVVLVGISLSLRLEVSGHEWVSES